MCELFHIKHKPSKNTVDIGGTLEYGKTTEENVSVIDIVSKLEKGKSDERPDTETESGE